MKRNNGWLIASSSPSVISSGPNNRRGQTPFKEDYSPNHLLEATLHYLTNRVVLETQFFSSLRYVQKKMAKLVHSYYTKFLAELVNYRQQDLFLFGQSSFFLTSNCTTVLTINKEKSKNDV
jgi:hypothetical protein